ncbi:hypothetical protein, partial [Klebsiella aerogenes]|uniref:hypothetical protein n=1 Tax=Klebsiella aerogenes TaxID=548 RepID=UPI001954B9C8
IRIRIPGAETVRGRRSIRLHRHRSANPQAGFGRRKTNVIHTEDAMYYFGYCTWLDDPEVKRFMPEAKAVTKG